MSEERTYLGRKTLMMRPLEAPPRKMQPRSPSCG